MMTAGHHGLARLTAAQVGLVMKTKVEMYYFLSMEGKCSCLSAGRETSSAVPALLRRSRKPQAAVDGLQAVAHHTLSERLPASSQDDRHVLPAADHEGREEGTSRVWFVHAASIIVRLASSSSRRTLSRRHSRLTSPGSASNSSWPSSGKGSRCMNISRMRSPSCGCRAASYWT